MPFPRWRNTVCFLILLCPAIAVPVSAQYRFDHWTTDNGLPQNTIRSIVQTRDGYLWMTTFDGLARFDGVRFTVFDKNNTPALSNNRLTALYEDKDGTLWIGADQGEVVAYRDGIFTSYTLAEEFRGASIGDFRRSFDDELMIVSARGAFFIRAGKFIPVPPEYINQKLKLYVGPSGTRWTIDAQGVRQIKDGRSLDYQIKFVWDQNISSLGAYEDSRGNLWLTDNAGVYRLRDGQVMRYTEHEGLPPSAILRPQCEDDDGGVWFSIGTLFKDGSGIVRFKDERFTVYGSNVGLPITSYTQLIKDREGSLWIATTSGLYRLRKNLITPYSAANGLLSNEVYPLLQARNGDIWVGTTRGLSLFRKGKFVSHPLNSFKEVIQSLCEDKAGRLWIGLLGSVRRYENGKITNLTPPQTNGAPVWAIHEDRLGGVWVATNRGLLKFEGDKVAAHYTTKDGLPGDDVKVIHESVGQNGQSVMWFGTFGGLAQFRDGRFISYTTAQGLTGNRVRSLYEDADGTLWIGTYDDGLSRFRNGRFFNYRTEQGLFNNGGFQILEDRHGYFWIGCNKGIYRVSRRELNEMAEGRLARVNSVAFGKQDGMLNAECNGGRQPAGLVAADGRLWFPTMGGVAVVDPEAAQVNQLPPPVMIESVTLDRRQVDFSFQQGGVTVAPGQRDLEIDYTGLSLMKSEQVNFKYKLEGLDTQWVEAGTRRVAYFPNLSPGSYIFRVIAANSDGVWNTTGASVRITVIPPFWRTWWFAMFSLGTVMGTAWMLFRRRIAGLEQERAAQAAFSRQLMQSQEDERKRIAAELHDSLGQSLAIIKNRALLSLSTPDDHDRALEQLREISEASGEVIDEVKEIAHNLRPYQLDRLGLTKTIIGMIQKVSETSDLRFAVEVDGIDGLFTPEGEINLFRIVQESVNNIVEHAQATEASVTIKKTDRSVSVTIRDNGKGFDDAK
ncbi:MAG: two-component regulator propeller domain-containing protein, partial [Blastocatellia bacterium]